MERVLLYQDLSDADFAKLVEQHVAALNRGLEGLPPDRVRLHVCWGNWEGPHNYDVAMDVILPALYQAKVGALGLEFANPRRQHETAALRKHRLPVHMLLIPGVIDCKSNFIEHPSGGRRGRRPRAGHRRRRLRLRHLCRLGMGNRGCGVGEAEDPAGWRGYRVRAIVGKAAPPLTLRQRIPPQTRSASRTPVLAGEHERVFASVE